MFPSRRARRLVLALAATSVVAVPGTAVAMPAGPDVPAGDAPVSGAPESRARVADTLQADGEDAILLVVAGAFALVAAGGTTLAHRRTHRVPHA